MEFDVVVVGGGPAGEVVAGRCADGGLRVALVERELVGGECSYWGCVPSKTLIRPGDVLAAAARVPGVAESLDKSIDIASALARRDYMTGNWNDVGQETWLAEHGITLVRGVGRLQGPATVVVTNRDGGEQTLTAGTAVVLATGTTAAIPSIDGLADARPWTNREITAAKEIPRRLVVLGGGAIGLEMAQALRRLGSEEVTIIEAFPRLLGREEPFAGEEVGAALLAEGVTILTSSAVKRVRRDGTDGPVTVEVAGTSYVGDELLVAAGRRPATTELGLETVGLTPGQPVAVDSQLRAIGVLEGVLYAVGDCNGRAPLTHMGKYQGRIAADVILGKPAVDVASSDVVPRVIFTDPQVCAVGLTEEQALERGIEVRAVTYGTGNVPGAYVLGDGVSGTSKFVVDERRRVLVGATFTGPGVQELLHSATVAIVGEVPLEVLWHAVPSFPTVSEVWLHLLEGYGL